MYQNIIFSGVGIFHPKNEVDNQFFIDHFNKMDIEIESLLRSLGKEKRFLDTEGEETVITMAEKACLIAMEKANVKPEEIDGIIFATDSPEFVCPSNALLTHEGLKTINANLCFDINTNCTGMITAFDIASRIMRGNPALNKVLIVGSLLSSLIASKVDPVVYSSFADSAVALVLEKKSEEHLRGFIESNFKTEPKDSRNFANPMVGFSNVYNPNIDIEDKKFRLVPFDTDYVPGEWKLLINSLLEKTNYEIGDIDHFFFSQFSKAFFYEMKEIYSLDWDKLTYVGDKYGYTGVNSPFMALNEAIEENRVNTGENLIFCSIGAGYNISAILYKV